MASAYASSSSDFTLDGPSWRLQHLGRSQQLSTSHLGGSGGFATWTNVPPVGVPDPVIANQMKSGRRVLTGPVSGHAAEPFGEGGKRVLGPHSSEPGGYGKLAYPEISGARSTDIGKPQGLKRVESRARRDTPAVSDPNALVGYTTFKPEGCKYFPGRNNIAYSAWKPEELSRAEYGDWNWNTKLGFRKVKVMENGEPKRTESTPVAFPGYKGYPADLQAGTGTRIDYALKTNGGSFTLKTQHPDVVASRANRAAASVAPVAQSGGTQPTLYRRGTY